MQTIEHVTNLELSKKLRELGYPQENNLFYWQKNFAGTDLVLKYKNEVDYINNLRDCIAAPIATELLKWLPKKITAGIGPTGRDILAHLSVDKVANNHYSIRYIEEYPIAQPIISPADSFANTLAKMLIWLVENGYVSFKNENK